MPTTSRPLCLFAALCLAATAQAANETWVSTGTGDWSTDANWSGATPTSGDSAYIDNSGTAVVSQDAAALNLYVGESGTGTVELDSGLFQTSQVQVGGTGGAYRGTVTVNGGTWNYGSLTTTQGSSGMNRININGGVVSGSSVSVAYSALTMNGGTWSTAQGLSFATSNVTINSGTATSASLSAINSSMITVSGGAFSISGTMAVGQGSSLNLGGGVLSSGSATFAGGNSIQVHGGTWINTGDLQLGTVTTVVLTLSSGTVSTNNVDFLRGNINASAGSWTNSGTFTVGTGGPSAMLLTSGSSTLSTNGLVINAGGSAQISGAFTNNGSLLVNTSGTGGTGIFQAGSGTFNTTGMTLGGNSGQGLVFMNGGTWTDSGTVAMVNGIFTGSGGTFSTNGALLGTGTGASTAGVYRLTGTAQLTNAGNLTVGVTSTGTLSLSGAARYMASSTITLGQNAGAVGVLAVNSGTLEVGGGANGLVVGAGSGTFTVGGGAVRVINQDFSTAVRTTLSGSAVVDTNGYNAAFSGSFTGTGQMTKAGSGTLTLSANNDYTGSTNVAAGTLRIQGDQSAATGATTVGAGGALSGTGVVGGDVSILSGGTLAADFTIKGALTLNTGAMLVMNFSGTGAGQYDQLDVQGFFTAGGTLALLAANGYSPTLGDSFAIFTGSTPGFEAGSFTITSNLAPGYYWDTSSLQSTGTVTVVPEPGALGLAGMGLGLAWVVWRRRGQAR